MNRSTVRRLVQGTKSRIKAAANTPRDEILKAIEYQKLLLLIDELDFILDNLSDYVGKDDNGDFELISNIARHRENLSPILHQLVSDSAHANSDGRAINRWSYKKKLHVVSKELVKGVEADILHLRQVRARVVEIPPPAFSTGADYGFELKSSVSHISQRTIEIPPPQYLETFIPEPAPTSPPFSYPPTAPHQTSLQTPQSNTSTTKPLQQTTWANSRGCLLIFTTISLFITTSCILGLYLTLDTKLGYTMGDAFTLAAYVVAVGALVSTAAMARHWPSCRCWRGRGFVDLVEERGGRERGGCGDG